ncbi:hypothetical protein ACOI1H_03870 [Loktanella sp. DJP18]|uniref:hypothetical protein n=1 Tax=Loktanella sp. DJP18 TaxID=3409788 RepID=UPI003BB4BCFA
MTDTQKTDLSETASTAEHQTKKFQKTGQTHDDHATDTSEHVTENMPESDKDTLKKTLKD